MISTKKIKAIALIGNIPIISSGIIEITNIDLSHKTAYVSWQIYDEKKVLLTALSKTYFIDKEHFTDNDIIKIVLENIVNYRVGRKKVFSEVTFVN